MKPYDGDGDDDVHDVHDDDRIRIQNLTLNDDDACVYAFWVAFNIF